jgi:hypothetical protein
VFSRVEREAGLKMTVENARPLQRILGLGFGVAIVFGPLDRVDVVPEREHLEVRNVAFHAVQTEGASVPRY